MFISNVDEWSFEQFRYCQLGDKRRTARLIEIAKTLAQNIGKNISQSCSGDEAAIEGAYRLIRNEEVKAASIAEGLYKTTKKNSEGRDVLLAIEDTTSITFTHSVVEDLGYTGRSKNSYVKGFFAHSVLLVDGQLDETLGLIGQLRWSRDEADYGKHHDRKERAYDEKESYKWEESSRLVQRRMGSLMRKVLSVCDRESDVYEYIDYKVKAGQRFVLRAVQDRRLINNESSHLWTAIDNATKRAPLGDYEVNIIQKSNRKARVARVNLYSCQVMLSPPQRNKNAALQPVMANVVIAKEQQDNNAEEEGLMWVLLTTEPAACFEDAIKIVEYYQKRWKIEEFHKAWKSGAGVERQRMQAGDNIERMAVILATIAVRLLQLKEGMENQHKNKMNHLDASSMLSQEELIVLWFAMQSKKKVKQKFPAKIPNLIWAYESIAKLGGWNNSKKLGRASWSTLWSGWFKLQERVEGYNLAKMYTEI